MRFNNGQPLWMPRGSGRLIMALIFTIGFVAAVFTLPPEQATAMAAMTIIVVKDYFDSRAGGDEKTPPNS